MRIKTIEVTNDKAFHRKHKINVKAKLKDYKTEDFWAEVSPNILPATQIAIKTYRSLVLNTFSHYNTERHEVKTELANAITAVNTLKTELDAIR